MAKLPSQVKRLIVDARIFQVAIVASLAMLAATSGMAHVRWFVDSENPGVENFQPYAISDPAVLIWIAVAAGLVAIAIFLDGRLLTIPVANSKVRHDVMELMRIFTGMSFLLTAYDGALVAPHLNVSGGFGMSLLGLQTLIGILLLSNHFLHFAAGMIFILFAGMVGEFGALKAIEYVNVIGIGLFLLFNYFPSERIQVRLKPYSVDMLRIFTGIALVTLAFNEKLHGAMLGQAFIQNYQWNFMPLLGFEFFSDRLFVLSAGVMEVVFGVILILGVVTRLNILVIAGFMLISNVAFLLQGENDEALIELIGHLPIIATALILILLGYGQRLKVSLSKKEIAADFSSSESGE